MHELGNDIPQHAGATTAAGSSDAHLPQLHIAVLQARTVRGDALPAQRPARQCMALRQPLRRMKKSATPTWLFLVMHGLEMQGMHGAR